ncbi:TPA: hypothetical protein UMF74_000776 [Stenotrophomonas maltophilia]|jgi:hypothetical protein|uniref:hypothetical protein n=1 Tax=Stenotrophomonas maltophilia TaxID=40324 RepID=UPI0013102A57|nr:hypothetical protein [Stenotrophomonas maltophilia]MBH1493663.1 hypothetical protein [Stenotrophomonas maltophilia]MBN4961160.1 hypothetical protein [Stenotrophomonas maltophilia]HDS1834159.1 hypothetical protein [Stenotrophomonas maltophilia]HEL3194164.1 hypothetical protein [Stenotrophomonas maltophilia]
MKWPAFFRKRPDAALSIEDFKQSPGHVLMDESGYLGLSHEAAAQIERLRQANGWGVRSTNAATTGKGRR